MHLRTDDRRKAEAGAPLVEDVADRIRTGVMTGRFEIGSRLTQEALASDFAVSRTPIREALRKLETEGLIELIPRRGAIVRGPDAREIREAYQVRAELEGLAAELAAEWITETELGRLAEANELFRSCSARTAAGGAGAAEAAQQWTQANDAFHEIIQIAARNDELRRTILGLHRAFPRNLTGMALSRDGRLLERNTAEHTRVQEAIAGHDGADARAAMTEHIRRSGEIVAKWFERHAEPQTVTTRGSRRAGEGR
jgi:DNA-binding GntR family transcriptional regulator